MPWPVILTTLTLALVSAWLVFIRNWEAWQAMLAVAFAAFGIISLLIVAIQLLSDRDGRAENWRVVKKTFDDDLDQMLKYFRIRKRKD
ncbi:hypothetical protein [Sulfuricella denitrificans]|nr:hypothetical protein [Sulfuricella denitrificans]